MDASALADNIASVDVIDPMTVKITMADKTQPLLPLLISPNFGIGDSKTMKAHGAVSSTDADKTDSATYLDQHSVGTGIDGQHPLALSDDLAEAGNDQQCETQRRRRGMWTARRRLPLAHCRFLATCTFSAATSNGAPLPCPHQLSRRFLFCRDSPGWFQPHWWHW